MSSIFDEIYRKMTNHIRNHALFGCEIIILLGKQEIDRIQDETKKDQENYQRITIKEGKLDTMFGRRVLEVITNSLIAFTVERK